MPSFDADYKFIIPSSRYMNNYEQIANHAPFSTIPGWPSSRYLELRLMIQSQRKDVKLVKLSKREITDHT